MTEAQQRTEEWYRARRGKLTASNLGALLGLVSYISRKAAYERIVGQEAEAQSPTNYFLNRACEWGTVHERDGIMSYMVHTGNLVNATGLHVHPTIPWLAGSPDGFIGSEGLIEVKCPFYPKRDGSSRVHTHVPVHYYLQMNALMEITGREWCDYVCWAPEGYAVYRVKRDPTTFEFLMNYYSQIYASVKVLMDTPPPLPKSEKDKIRLRVEKAMESTVDLTCWVAQILSNPPATEDSDPEPDADEVPPAKRLCVSLPASEGEESELISARTRQALRAQCSDKSFADAAEALLAFRYEKVPVQATAG